MTDATSIWLVTGASSGIGRAIVRHAAIRYPRAHFILTARRLEQLEQTAELAGCTDRCDLVSADLAAPDGPDRLIAFVRSKFDSLNVLINNAGVGEKLAFDDPDSNTDVDRMLNLNLRAPIILTQKLRPLLTKSRPESPRTIINITSVAGLIGTPGSPIYSATKWGANGFSEAIRARYAQDRIRVVNLQPGPVPTPGWTHENIVRSRWKRRLFSCDTNVIARTTINAVEKRAGGYSPVRPRIYRALPLLRSFAPPLFRYLLAISTKHSSDPSAQRIDA